MNLCWNGSGEGKSHRRLATAALAFEKKRLTVGLRGRPLQDELGRCKADEVSDPQRTVPDLL